MTRSLLWAVLAAITLPALQGCFPAVATGVAVGVSAAIDRRSVGTQTEDEAIEWKAGGRADKFPDAHINFTSYNRKLLISGEAPNETVKTQIGEIGRGVENVQGVWNEMLIGKASSFGNRSNDAYITSKVKARFIDGRKFSAHHVKVVTEAGTVFLLGLVTEPEAKAAIQIARTTDGVRKVVNVMEVLPEAEIKRLDSTPTATSSEKPKEPAAPAPVETR